MELGSCLGRPSSVVGWRTCNDLAGSRSLYAQRGPCRQSCGEDGPSAHRRSSGSSRHDATNWRGGTADAPWFQTMVATLASSSQTQVAETSPWGLWMEGGYTARPARRRTRNIKPWLPFQSIGFRVCKKWRPVFGLCFAATLTAPSMNRFQKTDALFPTRSTFFGVCLQPDEADGGCGAGACLAGDEEAVGRL